MKIIKISLSIIAIFLTSVTGMADLYSTEIGQFQKLKIDGNFNVVYKCLPDSTGFATYETEPGRENMFLFTTKGDGTLRIKLTDTHWENDEIPTLHIYSDFLTSVDNASDCNLYVENVPPCASFHANQIGNGSISVENLKCNIVSAAITTGNGSIYLSGQCINANYRMIGAGLISADRLVAENVKCSILGTGSIGCWALDNLNVKGIGTTKIYYKGKPNVKKVGGGKLFELP